MPTQPPRRRFQIHLSTAIVMMFVVGVLTWINTHARMPYKCCVYAYGWPFTAIELNEPGQYDTWLHNLFYTNMGIDLAVVIVVIVSVWYIFESLIRRRAAKKES